MEHVLKSWPSTFDPIYKEERSVDCRFNDRNYHVGDIVVLRRWSPHTCQFTGCEARRVIVEVLPSARDGYVYLVFASRALMSRCYFALKALNVQPPVEVPPAPPPAAPASDSLFDNEAPNRSAVDAIAN